MADRASWAPGEIIYGNGDIAINAGAQRLEMAVVNTGDRPVQVGSHVHLPQANAALRFDRDAAHGHRLDIPARVPLFVSNPVWPSAFRWSRSAGHERCTD
jgi:urease subunit beta